MKIWERIMESWVANSSEDDCVYTKEDVVKKLAYMCGNYEADIMDMLAEVVEVDWSHKYYGIETDNELYIYPLIYTDCISDLYYELRVAEELCDQVILRYLLFKGLNDEKIAKDIVDTMDREDRVYDSWMQEAVNNKEFMMMEF